ncbi:hypothetical protein QR680_016207 [Steinernema hermaphroditum]|uniref:Integrase zinc-binding domain-containing protein n=1 Tax=Steinernema hermaphroditum TaxID=289476 RepID=A0AA39LM84_9BILA|nr:hypothetical protein QR680_016207 [Steinernema hermaphroditum]
MYVDNLILTTENMQTGLDIYKKTKQIFEEIHMNLREYISNDDMLNKSIPEKDRATKTLQKVLGLQWSTSTDKIVLECAMELDDIITKRSVLKTHAKVFDPLGFLTPLTVKSKLFIQGLWPKNYGWDEQLSTDDRAVWKKVINAISGFRREIPRGICAIADKATLITFSDASGMAQAACAYLKCSDGPTHLIMSRSKVIGKFKEGTMPKLELDSFMIAIRMAKTICDESKLKCDIKRIVMFSDSKIALSWIKAEEAPHRAGAMVTRRWTEIRRISDLWENEGILCEIGYVNSEDNPADIASRGADKATLDEHIWWNGPRFLSDDTEAWKIPSETSALPKTITVKLNALNQDKDNLVFDRKEVTLTEYKRLFAIGMRFIESCLNRQERRTGKQAPTEIFKPRQPDSEALSTSDVHRAMIKIIQIHQRQFATGENKNRRKELRMSLDKDGIWRCRRRLGSSELPESANEPIFIQSNSKLAELIIKDAHQTIEKESKHLSEGHTIAEVRKRYWIPKLRSQVQKIKRNCVRCKRFSTQPFKYPTMSDLPTRRVTRSSPFEHIGLDYFGPFTYKMKDNRREKCYGCIFTCATTRLIHLEIVTDQTAASFLNALRRFFSRRQDT